MASPTTSAVPQQTLYLTPLIVCISILAAAALILVALHFLLKRFRNQVHPTPRRTAPNASQGVDEKVHDSISIPACRKELYQKECYICLSGLEQEEMIRVLPWCGHVLHVWCIDQWFEEHLTCPTCRLEITEADNSDVVVVVDDGNCLEGGQIRRAGTFASADLINDLMTFREKIRLKRCLSLDASQ